MSDFVQLARQGATARLVLARPDARNALTWEMWRAVAAHLETVRHDDAARILIVQGSQGCFAAGADIDELGRLAADRDQAAAYAADMMATTDSLARFDKPSIAMIAGPCVGGGMTLALSCDLRFAAVSARLGITPARLGLVSPLADTARLIAMVGLAAAKDLLFSGRLLAAEEALRLGLVDRVFEDDALEAETARYAGQLTLLSQSSIRAAKRMIARVLAGQSRDDAASRAEFVDALCGEDFQEGRDAFLAKRPALFRG